MSTTLTAPERAEQETVYSKESKKELDRKIIKSLAGNYGVTFKFAETFAPDENYEYRDRHFSEAKEMVFILDETEDKISLQHILFVGHHGVIKHWRQDWIYENRDFWKLVKGHEWEKITLSAEEVKGTWTQKVYQVDDCPRYEGFGTWVHVDGRHFWESTADAALPRREITTRDDYNLLRRHSHIEVFGDGSWLIEQDNEKVLVKEDNTEKLICLERGLERFTPDAYDVTQTLEWWEERKAFWTDVRLKWADIMENFVYIKVNEDEKLYMGQFALAERFKGGNYNKKEVADAVNELLGKHLENFN